ncbi:MAG: LptF/LptG family permease [Gemmatimonadota bacterium]|nr:LptF/LptG family permease [Gemmatimonadota bacterium]MDE3171586.1 LptF/LptG family permease [Gemmatimonadota bacterium]MDE3215904.1 LptF/LptG family permease [Gemmatimonadota bacterium]
MRHPIKPLDRYVFAEFWKIFVVTALGFPLITIVIDLTDHLDSYLARDLSPDKIALSYLYWIPQSMFMVLPAAVLFATVFSVSAFTRHSEITAAKASGTSFFRFIAPILVGAMLATGLDLVISELMPAANRAHNELIEADQMRAQNTRYNFAFAGDLGRVYKMSQLNRTAGVALQLQIERHGMGPDYPTYVVSTDRAQWKGGHWDLGSGVMHLVTDSGPGFTIGFRKARDNQFREQPNDMMTRAHLPDEMRYEELSRFITAMERSGADVNEWKVERALKIAIPVTCFIIALFGAPLATSNQRGGAAYGIAISLATTVTFLMAVQVTKAIGGAGIMPPDIAAWVPNATFAALGLLLLARVRT